MKWRVMERRRRKGENEKENYNCNVGRFWKHVLLLLRLLTLLSNVGKRHLF